MIDYLFKIYFPFFFDGVDVQMFSGAFEITASILLCSYCKWINFIHSRKSLRAVAFSALKQFLSNGCNLSVIPAGIKCNCVFSSFACALISASRCTEYKSNIKCSGRSPLWEKWLFKWWRYWVKALFHGNHNLQRSTLVKQSFFWCTRQCLVLVPEWTHCEIYFACSGVDRSFYRFSIGYTI